MAFHLRLLYVLQDLAVQCGPKAINRIDASAKRYLGNGCICASDTTVHLFRDEMSEPAPNPAVHHVLLSTPKSIGLNPEHSFAQEGTHRDGVSPLPHQGGRRFRRRGAIGFNYQLKGIMGSGYPPRRKSTPSLARSFLRLQPSALISTAFRKTEDGDHLGIRFCEAERNGCTAQIRLSKAIRQAWRTSLIARDQEPMEPRRDDSLAFSVRLWEIMTLTAGVS